MSERPLPLPDADTAFFWEGARRGELLILRCEACGAFVHYPKPACPACGGGVSPARVSGRGTVYSYTVTHQPLPGFPTPHAVVLVALEEDPGVRIVSNLVDVAPDDIEIGMPVEVVFEQVADDVALPLFRRAEGGRDA